MNNFFVVLKNVTIFKDVKFCIDCLPKSLHKVICYVHPLNSLPIIV
jgi:hypothetical protein